MFQSSMGTQIQCPNCRTPFTVQLEQVVDVERDPNAKARFLSGRLNVVACPNCGFQSRLAAPVIYHDRSKELLISHVPMELGLPKTEQDRVTGALVQAVVNSIPQEQRKGYLLIPKTAFTLQGMIETILEGDGITKEMLTARRDKIKIAEQFLQTQPEGWADLIKENDARLDSEFFELLTASAESALQAGQRDAAEAMLMLRDYLLQNTTEGAKIVEASKVQDAMVQDIVQRLDAFGENVTREQVAGLALTLSQEGEQQLGVLVSLAAPLMDYQFFEEITKRIEAAPADQRAAYETARDRMMQMTSLIAQQSDSVMRGAVETLNFILNSEDVDAAIRARADTIDEAFITVLQANVEHAEKQKDMVLAQRLKALYERVMAILQESAPPAIQFVNQLLQMERSAANRELVMRIDEFGPDLLQWMDLLLEQLSSSNANPTVGRRLIELRQEAVKALQSVTNPSTGRLNLDQGNTQDNGQGNNQPAPASGGSSNLLSLNRPASQAPGASSPMPPKPAPSQPNQDGGDTRASGLVLPFTRKKRD